VSGILYLHGFASGPGSTKGQVFEERFRTLGIPFHRADLTPGDDGFERSTPLTMLSEAERLARQRRPRALMGSSLGGYLSALLASRQPSVERLVLLAPAFGWLERWRTSLTAEAEHRWRDEGLEVLHQATGRTRRLGWAFMREAAALPAYPRVDVPTLCLAGRRDEVVPLEDVARFVAFTPQAQFVVLDDAHDLIASIDQIFEAAKAFLAPLAHPVSHPSPR